MIDWTPVTSGLANCTGTPEYRVEDDGLVRWRGVMTQTAEAIPWFPIPEAALPLVSIAPVYADWAAGQRSLHIPDSRLYLYFWYNGPHAVGTVVDLHPFSYQGTAPPPTSSQPLSSVVATYQLGDIVMNTGEDGNGVAFYGNLVDGWDSPDLRTSASDRPSDHGVYLAESFYGARNITIAGHVKAPNKHRLNEARDKLAKAVALGDVPLVVTEAGIGAAGSAGSKGFLVKGRRLGRVKFAPDNPWLASFEVTLTSSDPRKYSATEQSVSTNLTTVTEGLTFSVVFPVSFGGGTSAAITAQNEGTFPTRPVFEIRGPVTDPVIEHVESSSFLRFQLTLNAGDVLTVDTDARTVYVGGTGSRRASLVGIPSWFEFGPGTNTIRFSATSTDPTASLTAKWRHAYI